jgi:hypothetical protein
MQYLKLYNYFYSFTPHKLNFITFGGPNRNYHDAVDRLYKQAKLFDIFSTVTKYTEKDLQNDNDFWTKHGKFIQNNRRGYGYWLWKPYLILKKLKEIDDNDILLYLDAGCELDINGKNYFINKFIPLTNEKKIISTETSSNDIKFTKKDLVIFTKMENSPLLADRHMQAGTLMMTNDNTIKKLFEEFYQIASENYNLLDDSQSINKNHESFIEHRHDQSIFNMLVKKYNLINYDMSTNDNIINPIRVLRNKSGISLLK